VKYRVDPNIGENNNINTRESNRICDKEKHRHHASKIIPTDLMVSSATGLRPEILL
jgi:K+-transporting ATPase c subunit